MVFQKKFKLVCGRGVVMSKKSNDNIAISVSNVAKNFVLPHDKRNSVKSIFTGFLKSKKKGAEVQNALKDVSFDIKKGEFFGIVGRNGSGKSTLLKILAEIYQPTSGTVSTRGRLVPFIELGVGFNPELTGRQNVYLNGAMLGFSETDIDKLYDDIVEFAELERFMDQKLKNYSSGMQVRLAFSMATRSEADILLVDEVLAVGDADFQKKCYDYFKSLKKQHKTVVFVTHDMSAVREYCDRAVLIEKGLVMHAGSADAVATEYSKLFLPADKKDKDEQNKDRFGTGEIIFANIKHQYSQKDLTISFELHNTTQKTQEGIAVGFDFYHNNQLVTGNGTKYLQEFKKGLVFAPNEKKHLTAEISNYFGNFDFDLNLCIRSKGGLNTCDEIRSAISFSSNNTHMAQFFKVTVPLKITERKL